MNAPIQSSLFDRQSASATETKPAKAVAATPASAQPVFRNREPFARTHDMHENSIATYREEATAGHLSRRCSEIMEILERIGQGTDRQILAASKYTEMNSIQPRISELVKCGQLEEFDNIQDETTGKTVRIVRIADRATNYPTAAARHAARRQEQLANATAAGSASVPAPTPASATCTRCKGDGVRHISTDPDVVLWCDEGSGRPCPEAERLRAINPDAYQTWLQIRKATVQCEKGSNAA